MLEIVAVRHLPTQLNEIGVLQGRIDENILEPSAESLAVVNDNKKKIATLEPFDLIITSTLRRTISTANVYGFPEAIKESLLDELHFGEYERKQKSEMEAALGKQWHNEPQHIILGEPVLELEKRIRLFVDTYSNYDRVLVFGHGAWMRALVSISIHDDIGEMNKMIIGNSDMKIARFP